MNKMQAKEVAKLEVALKMGMTDYAARGLSELIRSTMSGRAAAQLHELAREWHITNHPEFIV